MIIKKAILHILDFNSGMSVFSQNLLDLADDNVSTFLQKHIEKLHKDSARKCECTEMYRKLLLSLRNN